MATLGLYNTYDKEKGIYDVYHSIHNFHDYVRIVANGKLVAKLDYKPELRRLTDYQGNEHCHWMRLVRLHCGENCRFKIERNFHDEQEVEKLWNMLNQLEIASS